MSCKMVRRDQRCDGSKCRKRQKSTASCRLGMRFFSTMSAISCATADAAGAALQRAGFAPTPVSVQVAPDGGPTGTGNVCAMMTRGYMEVLFKTADTPLGREFDAALSAPFRPPACGLRGRRRQCLAPPAWRSRLPHAADCAVLSGRSTPRPARTPPPSRWRGSSPARWRKAASRCSPTTPSTRCGSRAGSRIRTARAASRASSSSSPTSTRRRRATRASCIGRRSRRGQGRRCSSTAAGSIW